jgi:phosphotransferase system HPr (HPr) family protein
MSRSLEIIVKNKVGLHARPATLFVKEAMKFDSQIHVKNLTDPSEEVAAKSLLMILSIGVEENHTILINAQGEDEKEAIYALKALIENNFGET